MGGTTEIYGPDGGAAALLANGRQAATAGVVSVRLKDGRVSAISTATQTETVLPASPEKRVMAKTAVVISEGGVVRRAMAEKGNGCGTKPRTETDKGRSLRQAAVHATEQKVLFARSRTVAAIFSICGTG